MSHIQNILVEALTALDLDRSIYKTKRIVIHLDDARNMDALQASVNQALANIQQNNGAGFKFSPYKDSTPIDEGVWAEVGSPRSPRLAGCEWDLINTSSKNIDIRQRAVIDEGVWSGY
jgi:hypothetical protein